MKRNVYTDYSSPPSKFKVNPLDMLNRFLIIGSDKPTFYVGERKLTADNAKNVVECLNSSPKEVIARIVEVSKEGLAPSNDPALFALALASSHSNSNVRRMALSYLPEVARTGTHLLHFASYIGHKRDGLRGWGRLLQNAMQEWFTLKSTPDLAYQMSKYKSRDGWTMRDVLRMSHPKATSPEMNALFKWCVDQETTIPVIYDGQLHFLDLIGTSESIVINAIQRYGVVREQVPTEYLNSKAVWEALLEKMPMEAMLRNLAKMSSIGLLKGKNLNTVVDRLADENIVKKSRFHPLKVLAAWKTYSQGHGEKGNLSWKPEKLIEDVLQNVTFYHAFKTIVPSGKRLLLGLDVSGSMTWEVGFGGFDARTISAVMAMATVRTENCKTMAFSNTFMELNLKPDDNLYQVTQKIGGLNFSSTDCSLPVSWALRNRVPVDCFVVYTDNETNTGQSPKKALAEYRQKMGIDAKQIVVGITATNVTVADPNDPLTMDVAGFDSSAPAAISAFSKGA